MADSLKGKRIAILVTDGFEQVELTGPKEALEKAGATAEIISSSNGEVTGWNHTPPLSFTSTRRSTPFTWKTTTPFCFRAAW